MVTPKAIISSARKMANSTARETTARLNFVIFDMLTQLWLHPTLAVTDLKRLDSQKSGGLLDLVNKHMWRLSGKEVKHAVQHCNG